MNSQYAFISCLSSFMVRYSGVLGVEEPHQSIPNLVVKLYCGDDTVGEVRTRSRTTLNEGEGYFGSKDGFKNKLNLKDDFIRKKD
ncbi:hypothetical protein Ahy_A09g043689 [Arachis hypogaea]|uniref:Uncharacterized protein n=1 Tax=Arachis hypogaea TaxID=3818 RepID=A0A445BIW4_ARAHY|nr:hypothetical protein Ahy_A09g043689 [Arachis hypogaea]